MYPLGDESLTGLRCNISKNVGDDRGQVFSLGDDHNAKEFLHESFLRQALTDTEMLVLAVESEFPHDDDVLRRSQADAEMLALGLPADGADAGAGGLAVADAKNVSLDVRSHHNLDAHQLKPPFLS